MPPQAMPAPTTNGSAPMPAAGPPQQDGPPPPDFSGLPPAIAESLARLAGSIKSPPR
jgi:hypothetical protein